MNEFFPCILVEHPTSYSIICTNFHYFDSYFGEKGGGGYSVERLTSKNATMRWLGIMGLANTSCFSLAVINTYLDDKSKKSQG